MDHGPNTGPKPPRARRANQEAERENLEKEIEGFLLQIQESYPAPWVIYQFYFQLLSVFCL